MVISIWFLFNLFQSIVAMYRWYVSDRVTTKRYSVIILLFLTTVVSACPLVMKFFNFHVHWFTGTIFAQNILSTEILPLIFGLTARHLPELDNAIARIKSLLLICSFLQIVLFCATFSEGSLGGHCE